MIQKELCKELLQNKKFEELKEYFVEEYKVILDNLLFKKDIDSKDLTLPKTIILASSNYAEISDLLMVVSETIFDAEKGVFTKLDNLIDLYKPLKEYYDTVK